jgi:serine/threonine protein kinase
MYQDLSDDQLQLMHALCESFERAIHDGVPSIEVQLLAAPTSLRDVLFRELLAIELESRHESPTAAEYEMRFPDRHGDVNRVFTELGDRQTTTPPSNGLEETLDVGPGAATPAPESSRQATDDGNSFIGPYRLLRQIGAGGKGSVYLAEQVEPVERQVALKLIKSGMDSEQVIARFEAERQSLALMEHDSIARVLDAGTSISGQPYFVMELVRGAPITEYCEKNNLTLSEKLQLFVTVCHAIQHAHQKGIIYRDLKPSNVLVAESDGNHIPKVIDFGIANATGQRRADRTMFTELGQIVGTLEYMSPEQADLNELDIDTRSDVYSLGVLLYRLLTGTTPISAKELRELESTEMLRTIREVVPPKPSSRVTRLMDDPASSVRSSERVGLSKLLRRDLDWIVMKAVEKERGRRYESASALAADVQRFRNDEPVEASPPSVTYRLRKFSQRNKMLLAALATISAILVTATIVSGLLAAQAMRATTEEPFDAASC